MAIERLLFIKRFFSHPANVGAFFPSSKKLAEDLVSRAIKRNQGGKIRYLEIGSGSGALTSTIIEKMKPGDSLDLVELDPAFCQLLRKKFGHLPNINVHEVSILDFAKKDFDCVISSLPLNSFSPSFLHQIFKKIEGVVKKGGYLSYFEYRALGTINRSCLFGRPKAIFNERQSVKKKFLNQYCVEVQKSWNNFPPARIFHCEL